MSQPLVDNDFPGHRLADRADAPRERARNEALVRKALALGRPFWRSSAGPASHFSLGFLTLGGFVARHHVLGRLQHRAGADQYRDVLHLAATRCATTSIRSCKRTIHFTNRSGVRATCPDCHVPHEWTDKIARKMQASKEVWGKIFGTINTREKFLEHAPRAGGARMGAAEGQRFAGMPELPRLRIDGLHAASVARAAAHSTLSRRAARGPASIATRGSRTSCRT